MEDKQKPCLKMEELKQEIANLIFQLLLIILSLRMVSNLMKQAKTDLPIEKKISVTGTYDLSSKSFVFILCRYGEERLENAKRMKKYMTALSESVPGARLVLSVSPYTVVDEKLINGYHLNVSVERLNSNMTKQEASQRFKFPCSWFYFASMRFVFYRDYLRAHPEIEFVMFSDDDTLILRNPMGLLEEDPELVHNMYDGYPLRKMDDGNYVWLNAWDKVSSETKKRCNMWPLKYPLQSPQMLEQIPFNVGLMIGKATNVLKVVTLMADTFECVGMFPNSAEQGLINHLYYSGQINATGVRIRGHRVYEKLVSCPDFVGHVHYYIHANEIYAIHHYQFLTDRHLRDIGQRIRRLVKEV